MTVQDGSFENDIEGLSKAISRLTIQVRLDLLGKVDFDEKYSLKQIASLISQNADDSADLSIK